MINKIFSFFWKFAIFLLIVVVLGYVGITVKSCLDNQNTVELGPELPRVESASHSFYIENTGNLILASDFEQHGTTPGKRIFMLSGRWEYVGTAFRYNPNQLVLDEHIFGVITVKPR